MFKCRWWTFCYLFYLFGRTHSNQNTILTPLEIIPKSLQSEQFCNDEVELAQFLAIITQLYQVSPTCICVKMCDDQPTYCVPEGCLKHRRVERRIDPREIRTHSIKRIFDPSPLSFSSAKHLHGKIAVSDALRFESATRKFGPLKQISWLSEIRPNMFIDRYRKLHKYKKMPKLEIRYNFRERSSKLFNDHHSFTAGNLKRKPNQKQTNLLDKLRSDNANNIPIHSTKDYYIKKAVPIKTYKKKTEDKHTKINKREKKASNKGEPKSQADAINASPFDSHLVSADVSQNDIEKNTQ